MWMVIQKLFDCFSLQSCGSLVFTLSGCLLMKLTRLHRFMWVPWPPVILNVNPWLFLGHKVPTITGREIKTNLTSWLIPWARFQIFNQVTQGTELLDDAYILPSSRVTLAQIASDLGEVAFYDVFRPSIYRPLLFEGLARQPLQSFSPLSPRSLKREDFQDITLNGAVAVSFTQ